MVHAAVRQILQEELDDIIEAFREEIENEVRNHLVLLLREKVRECIDDELRRLFARPGCKGSTYPPSEDGGDTSPLAPEMMREEKTAADGPGGGPLGANARLEGLYLFCLTRSEGTIPIGLVGMEAEKVFLLSEDGLSAVVQRCRLEPYESAEGEQVKLWVQTHQSVVDSAQEAFGTILPFGFDTIIKPMDGIEAAEVLRKWLREESTSLTKKMARIEGKREYGIQVFYAPAKLIEKAIKDSKEVRDLREEMELKSPGAAFMLRQKVETAVRREMEQEAEDRLQEFLALIKAVVDDIRVEKNKKGDREQVMLLNLSVLVGDDAALRQVLDGIAAQEAFSIRFTGPWPPYSFVS